MKRRVRQLLGTELRHFVEVRRSVARYGEWSVSVPDLEGGGTAYSLGVGEDAILDIALIENYGFEVHAFDPTPRARAWVARQRLPSTFHFHPVGVAGYDGMAEFAPPRDVRDPSFTMLEGSDRGKTRVSCPVRMLSTLSRNLGHCRIELLKIDIEGAEYEVIDDLVGSELEVNQILVEFHHRFKGVGRERTARAVNQLKKAGYRIFSISPSGREYSFIRESSGSA
jgi:FkbM family methyltransferase